MLPKDKVLLLIRIPQEIEKRVLSFEQLLVNIHEILHHHAFTFEVTSYNQHIYFFTCIEKKLKELIEGQIYAQYPFSEIEEVNDYVKPAVLQAGFAGTELQLLRSDIIPIKTFKEFESDSLSGIFSVMTKAGEDEQIWIQVFVQPIADDWKLNFIRSWKMKFNNIKLYFRIKNYFKLKSAKAMREMEKEAYKHKAEHHTYKTAVRLAYVAQTKEKAQQKLNVLIKAFLQFNTIDLNGFKPVRIVRAQNFLKNYEDRRMPQGFHLSSLELASIYHFPHPDDVPHIVHVLAKKSEPPRDLPREGVVTPDKVSLFGITNFHNQNFKFGIKREDRRRHLYMVGKSGTGKSKMLELLIKEDILAGHGVGVLDPHGDLVDAVLRYVPENRIDDIVYFNPADFDFPVAFNPLEQVPQEMRVRVTIGFIDIFKKLFGNNWTNRLEHVLRYTTLALLDSPNTTVLSILKMLSDKNYRQKIVARIQDSVIKNFWVNEFAAWSEKFDNEAIMPILNKVGQFVSTSLIRNIVGQPANKINIEEIMNKGKILLMRISKGNLGEENAALIGSMVVTKIQQAAMARTSIPEEQRRDFYLYCDEFQYFATDTFSEILSEARKYHLNLTMAHQYMGQLSHLIRTTAFGNVGTIINFRVGAEDAAILENEYTPVFKVRDIINLGVREFYIKMSVDGELRDAFSGRTLNVSTPKEHYAEEIVRRSREKYARPREQVEEELKKWDEGATEEDAELVATIEQKFAEPLI
ncbi:type IV secretion system DNA-binding domain-containing protein [Candidatus Peregrinibacteria bacterium]|nr:type IV secretion system DNA-binding domain-containing protein [Candidatus Peregrinibacteria bacterium]